MIHCTEQFCEACVESQLYTLLIETSCMAAILCNTVRYFLEQRKGDCVPFPRASSFCSRKVVLTLFCYSFSFSNRVFHLLRMAMWSSRWRTPALVRPISHFRNIHFCLSTMIIVDLSLSPQFSALFLDIFWRDASLTLTESRKSPK